MNLVRRPYRTAPPSLSRRRLLGMLPPALAGLLTNLPPARLSAQGFLTQLFQPRQRHRAPAPLPLVYFGTDTAKAGAHGIYVSRLNPMTGLLTPPQLAAETPRPSYLAVGFVADSVVAQTSRKFGHRAVTPPAPRRVLYAANEGADEKTSGVSTFALDPGNGQLQQIGHAPSGGAGPCYVAVHPNGRWAYVANYAGGVVGGFAVRPDGTLFPPGDLVDFHQLGHRGPNAARQDAPHPHSATISPSGLFLVVNDLGSDNIATFPIDQTDGRLGAPNLTQNRTAGAGPRHVAFHPNGHWVYGIDELSSHIDQYLWATTDGSVGIPAQALLSDTGNSISTVAPDFHGTNTAAEIALSPEGTFCYASNRGEDSLVVFAVNASTGALSLVQRIPCGGRTPRQFTLSADGNWLLCGNQDSDSVTVFERDGASGRLRGPLQTLAVPSPMMTLFV